MRIKPTEEEVKNLKEIHGWLDPNCKQPGIHFLPNTPQHVIDSYENIKKIKKVYNTAK
ncbi:MAG: hypothetical protein ACOX1L_03375 [Erysipelotrichaceae bacterium]|jgi:hypothetical protein